MTQNAVLANTVLAIDTCGSGGTLALLDAGEDAETIRCIQQIKLPGRSASAQLMPSICSMLEEAGVAVRSLKSLIVVSGPGSFTGERVGLSTVKGLAHATSVPVIAVSRLAVLASLASAGDPVALLDAGRNEFYARHREREWLASHADIANLATAGEGLLVAEETVAEKLAAWNPELAGPLEAWAAARFAAARLVARDFDDAATLDANYLRRSDAELFARTVAASPS